MTVALISLAAPQAVVATFGSVPNPIILPSGDQVSAADVGWANDTFSLVNVTPFSVPTGQQAIGQPSYSVSNGVVTQTFQTQAIPPAAVANTQYFAAIATGITLTWSSSTTLNGTYAIDPTTMGKLTSLWLAAVQLGTFSNGSALQPWKTLGGIAISMSLPQFKLFVAALLKYIAQLDAAQVSMAAGGNPTWPSASVNVTG